jgi:hypothetical protein
LSHLLAATLASAAVTLVVAPASAAPVVPTTLTFSHTGATQSWTVPDDVVEATFDLYGAEGGGESNGGRGARVTATVPVTPGEVVTIVIGGAGGHPAFGPFPLSFNGGGDGWHSGGGGTDVRIGGTTLDDRVLVAGGGGGSASFCGDITNKGGDGGETGGDGSVNASCTGVPAGGATADAGGVNTVDAGLNGSAGQGGGRAGGFGNGVSGGGGGWYGGAGALNAAGGGGSSHGPAGTVFETGVGTGNGRATVTFAPSAKLTVATSGDGAGAVTSTPAGIDCGTTCAAWFHQGTDVTLTATPNTASTFTGWSGACTGTGACTTTLDQARNVTAGFAAKQLPLTVTKAGTGAGNVRSTPAGIDCGTTCSATFAHGTQVTLTPTPDASSTFSGWSGACTGTGACTVGLDQARDVTVNYATVPPPAPTQDPAPVLNDVRVKPVKFDSGERAKATLRWRVSEDVKLSVRLRRMCHGEVCGRYSVAPAMAKAGSGSYVLRGALRPAKLRPGSYRLTLVAMDSEGQRDRDRVFFRVRR